MGCTLMRQPCVMLGHGENDYPDGGVQAMTAVAMQAANRLSARTQKVINDLRSIIELSEWVKGERTNPPDLTGLNPKLTPANIEANRSDLTKWSRMFAESLATYRDLLNMTPAEWVSLRESDIVGLEGMIRQAAAGIRVWV